MDRDLRMSHEAACGRQPLDFTNEVVRSRIGASPGIAAIAGSGSGIAGVLRGLIGEK